MEQPKPRSMEEVINSHGATIKALGLEADPDKRKEFKDLMEKKMFDHLKTTPGFDQRYKPELSPKGNVVNMEGVEINPPTVLMLDSVAHSRIEAEVREELGMPAIE